MAKRKRLSPAQTDYLPTGPRDGHAGLSPAAGLAGDPPIAQVTREAAATAALEEVAAELSSARTEGRLIQSLPLTAIDRTYLVRDRIGVTDEDMDALKSSLRARGQQTPIDVVDLGQGRYGLISGWRRLTALETLYAETSDPRFASVRALLRQPGQAGDAYTAMVEENEIRVGLSPFERARIIGKSVEQGVFPDERTALRALFGSASRAKRSKIGSFLRVVMALEGDLRFPGTIAERLGLRMAQALESDPGFAVRLRAAVQSAPPTTAEAELAQIAAALRPAPTEKPPERAGLHMTRSGRKITLSGAGVTPELETRLRAWLRKEGF